MTTTAPTPNENPKRDRFTASAREITQAHAGLMVALKEGHDAYYGSHGIVTESLEFLVELARPIAPLVEAGALLVRGATRTIQWCAERSVAGGKAISAARLALKNQHDAEGEVPANQLDGIFGEAYAAAEPLRPPKPIEPTDEKIWPNEGERLIDYQGRVPDQNRRFSGIHAGDLYWDPSRELFAGYK
jgi:hypothetical protein